MARGLDIIDHNPGPLHEADIVLVTDGASPAERAVELKGQASTLGVTVLGIGIGVERHSLEPWCDVIEAVTDLNLRRGRCGQRALCRAHVKKRGRPDMANKRSVIRWVAVIGEVLFVAGKILLRALTR